ncbi:MAG: winged helix DNA-binding domain-containing protein [Pseudomonadota bacterium]|nr:winged helix DNA-binding domain-containing protein [Pseudomonadota bacterium]
MHSLSPAEARRVLLGAAALGESLGAGGEGVRALLDRVGAIQIDPIDRVGTNADLVAFARVEGLGRGDLYRHARGSSFEHFAKERCLLHGRYFAHYRGRAVETPWWRHSDRMKRIPASLLDDVRAEVHARGPVSAQELTPRGQTEAMDWSGWKGTTSLAALAVEVLWTRCEVVASGRDARGRRLYASPEAALGPWATATAEGDFGESMLLARVRSAGLLARAGGPTWSMLAETRVDGTVERLLAEGRLLEVRVGRRPYLLLPDPPPPPPDDGAVRILGPLDALVWDRALVREAFDFDYIWEIYKPASERTWGYYVCPILADGALVGRIEARREGRTLVLERWWGAVEASRLIPALERLATCNNCTELTTLPAASPHPSSTPLPIPSDSDESVRARTSKDASRANLR